MPHSSSLKPHLLLLLFAYLAVVPTTRADPDDGGDATDYSTWCVRDLIRVEFNGRKELTRRGEKTFPEFEAILSDKEATLHEIRRVFVLLRDMKGDRSRFVKHAVRNLKHTDSDVRWHAVWLLEYIGTTKEARQVYELVSDSEMVVMYAAIKTTGAIGGPLQLANLDRLLQSDAYSHDAHFRAHVKKYRDQLKNRLAKEKKAAKEKR